MLICESTRYVKNGYTYKNSQKSIKVMNEIVYDIYDKHLTIEKSK